MSKRNDIIWRKKTRAVDFRERPRVESFDHIYIYVCVYTVTTVVATDSAAQFVYIYIMFERVDVFEFFTRRFETTYVYKSLVRSDNTRCKCIGPPPPRVRTNVTGINYGNLHGRGRSFRRRRIRKRFARPTTYLSRDPPRAQHFDVRFQSLLLRIIITRSRRIPTFSDRGS